MFVTWQQSVVETNVHIVISNTSFERNYGHEGGLGLQVKPVLTDICSPNHFTANLTIVNCKFSGHYSSTYASASTTSDDVSESVIRVENMPHTTIAMDGITVESNQCTALLAVESGITFHGFSRISNNIALIGAGL